MFAQASLSAPSLDQVQSDFVAAMPRIARHARCYFRHVRCQHKKADFVSEVVSICWKWWRRLVELGKNPARFASALATYAAKAVRTGRRVCCQLKPNDVLSERAQQRHGFSVSKLPDHSTLSTNPLTEALAETPSYDPSELAAFRIDFPSWRRSHSQRYRRIIDDMLVGERTLELANKHGLSPARVSQLRREFHADWQRFTGAEQTAA